MSGQIQLMADPMLSSLPLAQGGKIKALAVTSAKRMSTAPDIPTVARSGMSGFEFVSWYGLWAPRARLSSSTKLQSEVAKIVALPEVKKQFDTLGFERSAPRRTISSSTSPAEMAKSAKIIEDAKIKTE